MSVISITENKIYGFFGDMPINQLFQNCTFPDVLSSTQQYFIDFHHLWAKHNCNGYSAINLNHSLIL